MLCSLPTTGNTLQGACRVHAVQVTGDPCMANEECMSNICSDGVCQGNAPNSLCRHGTCQSGYYCKITNAGEGKGQERGGEG